MISYCRRRNKLHPPRPVEPGLFLLQTRIRRVGACARGRLSDSGQHVRFLIFFRFSGKVQQEAAGLSGRG